MAAAPRPARAHRLAAVRGAVARCLADGGGGRRHRIPGLRRDGALRRSHGGRQLPDRTRSPSRTWCLPNGGCWRRCPFSLRCWPPNSCSACTACSTASRVGGSKPRRASHGLGHRKPHPVRWPQRGDGFRRARGVCVPDARRDRCVLFSRWRGGSLTACAQFGGVGDEFLADANPILRADGGGAVPHRPRHQGNRRHRQPDPPRAGPARGHHHRRRHGVLGDLRFDHRHHRDAGQPDAADHAQPRLRPAHGDGPDHGDRQRRRADSAVGARRAAWQPRWHLDLGVVDRRHRAGTDPERDLHRLYRAARPLESVASPGARGGGPSGGAGALAPVCRSRYAARSDLCRRGRSHDARLGDADRGCGAGRGRDHRRRRALSQPDLGQSDDRAQGHSRGVRHHSVHHRRRHHVLPGVELLRRDQRHHRSGRRSGPATLGAGRSA